MRLYKTYLSCSLLAISFLATSIDSFSQKQMELVSQLSYPSLANDVWGYTAPDGTEYALVGLRSGVSIVSMADPANLVEIVRIPGEESTWRDLKTWGHFAYVTADQANTKEGLLVIDLSGLPDNVTWERWRPVLPGQTDSLFTCHNLWIDENGYCYLSGCQQNDGGVIILDVFSTPGQPQFVAYNEPTYAHDCFAQNNLLYTAEIYEGQFQVFDITNKQAPVKLATQRTPYEFCHNVWPNADGSVLFTTDERANAPTAAFDLSDLGNVKFLDEFRSIATINTGVIPHNAHVRGNYVVISNYTDGCVVVDATKPDNLVEAEYYGTCTNFDAGFHGCWGAYPYFPSGLIAASDIENGLFILKPNYPKVAFLEGRVTNKKNGAPIGNVKVEILSSDTNSAATGLSGLYKTGQASEGTFDVVFKAKGFYELTAQATLVGGETTILDVQMEPLPIHVFGGTVYSGNESADKNRLSQVSVILENGDFRYETTTDENGHFEFNDIVQGDYSIYLGVWGHQCFAFGLSILEAEQNIGFHINPGYTDDFNHDLGWSVTGTATNGIWERDRPIGINASNKQFTPDGDSSNDPGNSAYVTGNQGVLVHDDQVDNGETQLTSPAMQLSSLFNRPMLSFDYWWYNAISNNPADDSLVVSVTNGKEAVVLKTIATNAANVQAWTETDTFDLAKYLEITDSMRIVLTASDRASSPNVVEAGIDNFMVWDALPEDQLTTQDDLAKIRLYPNPNAGQVVIDYKINKPFKTLKLLIANPLGQTIREITLDAAIGTIELDLSNEVAAPYFVSFRVDGKLSKAAKLMKVVD